MKIICKVKDYYDYLSGVNGIDPLVVYDRRDCMVLSNDNEIIPIFLSDSLSISKNDSDKKKIKTTKAMSPRRYYNEGWYYNNEVIYEGKISLFCIIVGYKKYVIECERYLDDNDKLCLDYTILENTDVPKEKRMLKNYPIIMHSIKFWHYRGKFVGEFGRFDVKKASKENDIKTIKNCVILNPIFKGTRLTSIIPAEEMWDNIYSFISSLNEKDITDKRDDNGHIVSHGFNIKESFRNVNHRLK